MGRYERHFLASVVNGCGLLLAVLAGDADAVGVVAEGGAGEAVGSGP